MLRIEAVDYKNAVHAAALLELLDHYAQDPMGGGEALPAKTRENLIAEMAARSTVYSFIAWHEKDGAVGLINCVEGFSTFAAKPVCNLHDIAVREGYRGQNIGQKLIAAAAEKAKQRGCVKLTLEVLSGNEPARLAYRKFGFKPYQLDPEMGQAEFWEFKL
ncbi:GNAT family N-acetyltransferase [Aliidiomarina iranensis]|uniref:GNAT family N-acetyltransferase n=1 Tax=Aliidiomarina iranensis TaxID=1434071 RepID=A0A432W204_9GAMM|nr:GNAT family N-acetyltransferase [Aliidiomarina iranensis]RUO23146.1 GNAT family N-acetyltransferase [Aliidiomarina iranensis]